MTLTDNEKLIMFATMLTMVRTFYKLSSEQVGEEMGKYIMESHPTISPIKLAKILNDVDSQLGKFDKTLVEICKEIKK